MKCKSGNGVLEDFSEEYVPKADLRHLQAIVELDERLSSHVGRGRSSVGAFIRSVHFRSRFPT